MWSTGLPVVIKTAIQVVSVGRIFLNVKWRTRVMPHDARVTQENKKTRKLNVVTHFSKLNIIQSQE